MATDILLNGLCHAKLNEVLYFLIRELSESGLKRIESGAFQAMKKIEKL